MSINLGGAEAFSSLVTAGGAALEDIPGLAQAPDLTAGTTTSPTISIGSGLPLQALDDAVIQNWGVFSSGQYQFVYVESGGQASGDTVKQAGIFTIDAGGIGSGTMIFSGGVEQIQSGGVESGATVLAGGELVYQGGTAAKTILSSGASAGILSATVSGLTIPDGVSLFVSSGGVASGATILGGGTESILFGGVDSSVMVESGGVLSVGANGIAWNAVISGGTVVEVGVPGGSFNALFINGTLEGGAVESVGAGASTRDAVISNGAVEKVLAFGESIFATVASGGLQEIFAGGSAGQTTILTGGTLTIISGAAFDPAILAGGALFQFAGTTLGSPLGPASVPSGTGSDALIPGGLSGPRVQIAGHATILGGTLSNGEVKSGGFEFAGTFNNGPAGGTLISSVVDSGGILAMGVHGEADDATIDTGGFLFGLAGVTSNAFVAGTQFVGGGLPGVPLPNPVPSAVAIDTVVAGGGKQNIASNGSAVGTTILSGGEVQVNSGGLVVSATVSSGGVLLSISSLLGDVTVLNGGVAEQFVGSSTDTTLSGGKLLVFNGAVASGINVGSGGFVLAGEFAGGMVGGTLLDPVLSSGGLAVMGADATIDGAEVQGGATIFELAGQTEDVQLAGTQFVGGGLPGVAPPDPAPLVMATGTTVLSGGVQILNSNGSAIGTSVLSGGEIVFNGGMTSGLTLASGAMIDAPSLVFASSITLSFVENPGDTGGTLTVTSGASSHSVDLLGQYAAAGFHLSQDSGAGTLITYGSAGPAALGLAANTH